MFHVCLDCRWCLVVFIVGLMCCDLWWSLRVCWVDYCGLGCSVCCVALLGFRFTCVLLNVVNSVVVVLYS